MIIIFGIFFLTISILLFYIGRKLQQIMSLLYSGKCQLEDYLRVVCESTEDEVQDYRVGNEEKQILWSLEEKERLFNDVLQEMFN